MDDDELTDEHVLALDGLAEHAISEFEAGWTISLDDFAREQDVNRLVGDISRRLIDSIGRMLREDSKPRT